MKKHFNYETWLEQVEALLEEIYELDDMDSVDFYAYYTTDYDAAVAAGQIYQEAMRKREDDDARNKI
jgi:hypothetical protein